MKRTQIGWVFLIIIPAITWLIWQMDTASPKVLPMLIVMALVLLNGFCLTVTVDDEYVRFSFGIGLFRRKYAISDIEYCKSISYFSLGWGIRFRSDAILYNVSGNKAIELTMKGKFRKVWIGTDVPDELSTYINKQIQKKL